jgi:hypothetical protein
LHLPDVTGGQRLIEFGFVWVVTALLGFWAWRVKRTIKLLKDKQPTAQDRERALQSAQWEFRLRVLNEHGEHIDSDVEQDSHQVASGQRAELVSAGD